MTLTPEERAAKVVDDILSEIMGLIEINGEPIMSVSVRNPAPALIAQAITQAQDEKLDEAALHVGLTDIKARIVDFTVNGQRLESPPGNTQFIPLPEGPKIIGAVQSAIRSLKSKD